MRSTESPLSVNNAATVDSRGRSGTIIKLPQCAIRKAEPGVRKAYI